MAERKKYRIEMWESKDGWRWRIRSDANGKILASSQAYKRKQSCQETVENFIDAATYPGAVYVKILDV